MCEKRKVKIYSNQYFQEGYLIGYSMKKGIMYAIIETDYCIKHYDLVSIYFIEFV